MLILTFVIALFILLYWLILQDWFILQDWCILQDWFIYGWPLPRLQLEGSYRIGLAENVSDTPGSSAVSMGSALPNINVQIHLQ